MSKPLTVFVIISGVAIIIFMMRLPDYVFSTIGLVLTIAATLLILSTCGIYIWLGVEHALTRRADRQKAQAAAKAARYISHQDGFGMVHLHSLDTDIIENLSAFPGTHHNGRWEEPHPAAAAAWFALVARRGSESPIGYLPETTRPVNPQIDLLNVMTQPTQSYAIIAGQQVGKTYQARRIAAHWIQSGLKPLVIGPKWDTGEWEGCTLFGGEYNLERVAQGMRIIKKLAEDRHASSGQAHKSHPIQPVFFDDWTAIRAKLPDEAENFILDATTLYASVNIILYFILHLDTANAWGVGKIGAALKNNFIKLLIEPGYDSGGLIDRRRNTGYILMPGQGMKDKRQVRLFDGTGQAAILPDLVLQPGENVPQVEQLDQDKLFVRLVRLGHSRNEASLRAYGRGYAGNLVERGRRALGEI